MTPLICNEKENNIQDYIWNCSFWLLTVLLTKVVVEPWIGKKNQISLNENSGSIDNEITRKDIVNIMEGGNEAFNNRKRIYDLWTH